MCYNQVKSEIKMISAINTALSGMAAQAMRVAVSANNIANVQSVKAVRGGHVTDEVFMPQDVFQISDENGGTIAYTKDSGATPISSYDPQSGVISMPNVDVAAELAKVTQASFAYKSNLKMLELSSETLGNFFNRLA
jgi:flagellar basal body rod protein FlgC